MIDLGAEVVQNLASLGFKRKSLSTELEVRAMKRFTPRVTGLSRLIALAFMAIGLWQTPAFGGAVVWDGGTGDWFGPWLGNLPGVPAPSPTPTTNWTCEVCVPGAKDTANIGTLFGSPIGPVTGAATGPMGEPKRVPI